MSDFDVHVFLVGFMSGFATTVAIIIAIILCSGRAGEEQ